VELVLALPLKEDMEDTYMGMVCRFAREVLSRKLLTNYVEI
jgi:hypothetical protein